MEKAKMDLNILLAVLVVVFIKQTKYHEISFSSPNKHKNIRVELQDDH